MSDQPPWTIAEVKGELARLGAELKPDARMQVYERPRAGTPIGLCVVETVESVDGKPPYCVHGFASCVGCEKLCYLGSETSKVVADRSRGVYPICIHCAETRIPTYDRSPIQRLIDRPR